MYVCMCVCVCVGVCVLAGIRDILGFSFLFCNFVSLSTQALVLNAQLFLYNVYRDLEVVWPAILM